MANVQAYAFEHPPISCTITNSAGAANTWTITVQVVDGQGNAKAGVWPIEAWISEAATGIGLTADSYSGTVTATAGAIHTALTAKKHFLGVTAATGQMVFSAVDSAKPADQYFVVKPPYSPVLKVSAASGTNWGA